MKKFIDFLGALVKSIKYNGLFIILSVLFPLLFIFLDAGRELFYLLEDSSQFYNVGLVALAFYILSMSIWCLPGWSVELFSLYCRLTGNRRSPEERLELMNSLKEEYDYKGSDFITNRFWAIFPWIIFNLSAIWVYWNKWAAIVAGITLLISLIFFRKEFYQTKFNEIIETRFMRLFFKNEVRAYFLFLSLYALPVGIYFLFFRHSDTYIYWLKYINIIYFSFLTLACFIHIYRLDKAESAGELSEAGFRMVKIRHGILLIISLTLILLFYLLLGTKYLQLINPMATSIIITSFLILSFELLVSSQLILGKIAGESDSSNGWFKIYPFVVGVSVTVLTLSFVFSSLNDGVIRTELPQKARQYSQPTLENYFNSWYQERLSDSTYTGQQKEHVIYLVSGQGGGSRAAAWFIMAMKKAESADPAFFNKVFSISAVSGSISGANMYLASKHFDLIPPYKIDTSTTMRDSVALAYNHKIDSTVYRFCKQIYGANYLSSAIYGLIVSDYFFDGFLRRCVSEKARDRNYYFQNEEVESFISFMESGSKQVNRNEVETYFLNDYLENYSQGRARFPLFFINSTAVENGTKAIFSPIQLKGLSLYKNIYQSFREATQKSPKNLPLITCVNQGQAFPLINAYNFLPGVGRLGDGGLYENSGTETTLEVYQALKKIIDTPAGSRKPKIRLVCLTILNSPTSDITIEQTPNSLFATVEYAAKSPFEGREKLAITRLSEEAGNEHILLKPVKSYSLTRALSNKTIDSMNTEMIQENITVFLNRIKDYSRHDHEVSPPLIVPYSLPAHRPAPLHTLSPDIRLFVQYHPDIREKAIKIFNNLPSHIRRFPTQEVNLDFSNSVRYFKESDSKDAHEVARLAEKLTGTPFEVLNKSRDYPEVPAKQIEVWVRQ